MNTPFHLGARLTLPLFFRLLIGAAGSSAVLAQNYTFSTLAGSRARFSYSDGVAVDRSGDVIVADSGNCTIRRINNDGSVVTLAGAAGSSGAIDGPADIARFKYPGGVAVDSAGTIFVADTQNHTIRRLSADGVVTTLAGEAGNASSVDGIGTAARFNTPRGLAVDAQGNIFVADHSNHTIRKITAGGVVTTFAGRAGDIYDFTRSADGNGTNARFNLPTGIAIDASGNLYVTDSGNHTIRKITAGGTVTTLAGKPPELIGLFGGLRYYTGGEDGVGGNARFYVPWGLGIDRAGNLYVGDNWNRTIRRITQAGIVTTFAGTALYGGGMDGTGSGQGFSGPTFSSPQGVAVDANGNVFVADASTIRKITPGAMVTTLAGLAGITGSADSPATERFSSPLAVATDGDGNAYVSNFKNFTISKIAPDGVVTTLAGIPGTRGSANGAGNAATFFSPRGVAAGPDGDVFVADAGTHRIRKTNRDGFVSTWAGAGRRGDTDGTASEALFSYPTAIATDSAGSVFVADTENHTIRKITADGTVITIAGGAGNIGSADGLVAEARFYSPEGIAVDRSGNVFVADTGNHVIRKLTDRVVTTLAGSAGARGQADGRGPAARFNQPVGLAVDDGGYLFVADAGNHAIRRISPGGVVTTVAGNGTPGDADGIGPAARFRSPFGVAVDRQGNLLIADSGNNLLRKGVAAQKAAPLAALQSQHVAANASATFAVTVSGSDLTYQWKKEGVAIAGATQSSYTVARASAADMGFYSVAVTGLDATRNPVESPVAILTVDTGGPSRLSNLSTCGFVPTDGALTVGFVVRGGNGKSVLARAVGSTLASFGVSNSLADPRLDIVPAGAPVAINSNDNWGGGSVLGDAFAGVGAFPLPAACKDAALTAVLPSSGYSARVTSALAGGAGLALVEIYDRDALDGSSRFVNLSALGFAGYDDQSLVPGFVVGGTAAKQLLIRAVGPGLTPFGVTSPLPDPQIAVVPLGGSFTVASNDNWDGLASTVAAFQQAGAFDLTLGSKDAALVVRLPPGGYTVTVTGAGDTTGTVLMEIYDLDR